MMEAGFPEGAPLSPFLTGAYRSVNSFRVCAPGVAPRLHRGFAWTYIRQQTNRHLSDPSPVSSIRFVSRSEPG